jgi:hypothetical protein
MGQERVDQALGRIERALARIEAAASPASAAEPQDGAELARLREAHLSLRGQVRTAVARIDRLLAAEQG